tara:strand:- start:3459 stop:4397 length:939 start_codon:yes stop_codon:yes gene_type:complete
MNRVIGSAEDFTKSELNSIFRYAKKGERLFAEYAEYAKGKILGTLFIQPSLRTQQGFKSAFMKLGGNCLGFDSIANANTDSNRYESLSDSSKFVSEYCDIAIMRCQDPASFYEFAENASIPVISAGHGKIEHPSTGLTEVFSLMQHFGEVNGLSILIFAKLPKRCTISFIKCLSKWKSINLHFITAEGYHHAEDTESFIIKHFSRVNYYYSVEEFVHKCNPRNIDILYIDDAESDHMPDRNGYGHWNIIINEDVRRLFRPDVYITAPLPRTRMLPVELDKSNDVFFLKKAPNSLIVRASLLIHLLQSTKIEC